MENELPEGWVETTLENIAEWGSGGTPNRSEKKYYDGNIPWVKTGDLNDGLLTEASEYITELGLKSSSANTNSDLTSRVTNRGSCVTNIRKAS